MTIPKQAANGGWRPASHGPATLRHPEGLEYKVTFWNPRLIDAEIEVSVYHADAGRRPITRRRRITVYVSATYSIGYPDRPDWRESEITREPGEYGDMHLADKAAWNVAVDFATGQRSPARVTGMTECGLADYELLLMIVGPRP